MVQKFLLKQLFKLVAWSARHLLVPALIWFSAKHGLERWQFRKCQACAEKIRRGAVVCRHCGQREETEAGAPSNA